MMQLHKFHQVFFSFWRRTDIGIVSLPPPSPTRHVSESFPRPCVTYSGNQLSYLQPRVGKLRGRIGDDIMAWNVEHEGGQSAAGGSKLCFDIYTQTEA